MAEDKQNKTTTGEDTEIACLRLDIEQYKGVIRKLKDERDRAANIFESIVETSGVGIMIEDEKGLVSYTNSGLVKMLGYDSKDDILGHPWIRFFSLEQAASYTAGWAVLCWAD